MANSDCAGDVRAIPIAAALAIAAAVAACMVYGNLALTVTKQDDFRYFPPFAPNVNVNMNRDLGSEYYHIARSLAAGHGFANPFGDPTGSTAWMPPILPTILAALWRACAGNREAVIVIVLAVQAAVLIGTGLFIIKVARHTTERIGPNVVAAIYIVAILGNFRDCFQANGDRWINVLLINAMVAGCFWYGPFQSTRRAVSWGAFGGLCALINPVGAFAWGTYSTARGVRQGRWGRTALMLGAAALVVAPWTARNYFVLGRLIPVKSNLAYEVYQSQCLQSDGLLNSQGQNSHPIHRGSRERREYEALGEIAYLDHKATQAAAAIAADPLDFLDRVAWRFLGATLDYVPTDRSPRASATWFLWLQRLTHPLPFLGLLVLIFGGLRQPLTGIEYSAISIYVLYLTPFVLVSYYPRYGFPLLAVKVLLVIWTLDRLKPSAWAYSRRAAVEKSWNF